MRSYKKESKRLKDSKDAVNSAFRRLGINKKQETIRLVYEISKRDNVKPPDIVRGIPDNFKKIKDELLKRRFPYASLNRQLSRPHLPKLKLDQDSALDLEKSVFYPDNIIAETSASRSKLSDNFRKAFPKAKFSEIKSLKDHLAGKKSSGISDYNKRRGTVFITHENYDFFKKCPCTKMAVGCGYHIFNLSFGCIFDCTYCYLQEYMNVPGLIFPANLDRFFQEFPKYKKPGMRIGTGEFSDSLMLDHITEYSLPIIDFFKKHRDVYFEFKTKSVNIDKVLKANHSGNIVTAWSLNPQSIIDENEFFAPSLKERLKAIKKCADAGYKIACHFDPVIYFNGWEKEYGKVIDMLFDAIKVKDIAWISIGTLRFNPKVKQVIEARFPGNELLDGELVPGFDNKLRYPHSIRHGIYSSMLKMLSKHSKKLPVYLCMENSYMWKELRLRPLCAR